MGLRRQLNREGIAHAHGDSSVHLRHVLHRQRQRAIQWIPEVVQEVHPADVFKLRSEGLGLTNGRCFIGEGETESEVPGEVFEKHLSAINWERRWHFAKMKRGEKICTVRRKRKQPAVGEFVVNLAPWQMTYLNRELELWEKAGIAPEKRKEMLLAFFEPLRRTTVKTFKDATGYDVLAAYEHWDSTKCHVGILNSRIGSDNQLRGGSLKTIGPFSVAVARIQQVGAGDPADPRLGQNLERFRARHGKDAVPLDMQLHAALDSKFDELVVATGPDAEMRYDAAKQHYREWKTKARRDSVVRSPGSQRIGWEVLRLVTPLFPPQVQATIRFARTAYQAFQVVSTALDSISTITQPQPTKTHEITKSL